MNIVGNDVNCRPVLKSFFTDGTCDNACYKAFSEYLETQSKNPAKKSKPDPFCTFADDFSHKDQVWQAIADEYLDKLVGGVGMPNRINIEDKLTHAVQDADKYNKLDEAVSELAKLSEKLLGKINHILLATVKQRKNKLDQSLNAVKSGMIDYKGVCRKNGKCYMLAMLPSWIQHYERAAAGVGLNNYNYSIHGLWWEESSNDYDWKTEGPSQGWQHPQDWNADKEMWRYWPSSKISNNNNLTFWKNEFHKHCKDFRKPGASKKYFMDTLRLFKTWAPLEDSIPKEWKKLNWAPEGQEVRICFTSNLQQIQQCE